MIPVDRLPKSYALHFGFGRMFKDHKRARRLEPIQIQEADVWTPSNAHDIGARAQWWRPEPKPKKKPTLCPRCNQRMQNKSTICHWCKAEEEAAENRRRFNRRFEGSGPPAPVVKSPPPPSRPPERDPRERKWKPDQGSLWWDHYCHVCDEWGEIDGAKCPTCKGTGVIPRQAATSSSNKADGLR